MANERCARLRAETQKMKSMFDRGISDTVKFMAEAKTGKDLKKITSSISGDAYEVLATREGKQYITALEDNIKEDAARYVSDFNAGNCSGAKKAASEAYFNLKNFEAFKSLLHSVGENIEKGEYNGIQEYTILKNVYFYVSGEVTYNENALKICATRIGQSKALMNMQTDLFNRYFLRPLSDLGHSVAGFDGCNSFKTLSLEDWGCFKKGNENCKKDLQDLIEAFEPNEKEQNNFMTSVSSAINSYKATDTSNTTTTTPLPEAVPVASTTTTEAQPTTILSDYIKEMNEGSYERLLVQFTPTDDNLTIFTARKGYNSDTTQLFMQLVSSFANIKCNKDFDSEVSYPLKDLCEGSVDQCKKELLDLIKLDTEQDEQAKSSLSSVLDAKLEEIRTQNNLNVGTEQKTDFPSDDEGTQAEEAQDGANSQGNHQETKISAADDGTSQTLVQGESNKSDQQQTDAQFGDIITTTTTTTTEPTTTTTGPTTTTAAPTNTTTTTALQVINKDTNVELASLQPSSDHSNEQQHILPEESTSLCNVGQVLFKFDFSKNKEYTDNDDLKDEFVKFICEALVEDKLCETSFKSVTGLLDGIKTVYQSFESDDDSADNYETCVGSFEIIAEDDQVTFSGSICINGS